MATNTKNFNFKKPDESDFYSIQDQNGNWDLADEELQKLNEPAFEDYTTGTSVPSAATALEALKSKIKLPIWMSNVVAFCKGCCTLAMIVNNCVSSDADKPLAAAQGKVLQDQLTKLYSDLGYYITSVDDFSHTLIGEVRKNITLNSKITLGQYTRVLFMNILNSKDGALLAIAPGDKIITAFRNNGVWEEKSSHFIATKSDLANKTKSGSATISTKQNDSTALQIRFDEPFPSRPYVTVSLNTDNANTNTKISVFGIDQTGFKVSIYDTAATTRRIEWIASV